MGEISKRLPYVMFLYYALQPEAYCAIWVRRSNFRHQASSRVSPRESTQRRKVELWARNVREFCLLHAVKLRHRTDGFTSPPKEGVLRIFFALKIRRLRPGVNPRTKGQHATSRPPNPLSDHLRTACLFFRPSLCSSACRFCLRDGFVSASHQLLPCFLLVVQTWERVQTSIDEWPRLSYLCVPKFVRGSKPMSKAPFYSFVPVSTSKLVRFGEPYTPASDVSRQSQFAWVFISPCLISNLLHKILIYLYTIHLLKSFTCFEHYPAHPQEVYVVIVYMQPLVSSLSAGDCRVHRLRKNALLTNHQGVHICKRLYVSRDTRGKRNLEMSSIGWKSRPYRSSTSVHRIWRRSLL